MGKLYVTFAKQDATLHDDVAGPGHGFVDVFTNARQRSSAGSSTTWRAQFALGPGPRPRHLR